MFHAADGRAPVLGQVHSATQTPSAFLLQEGKLDRMLNAWESPASFQQPCKHVSGHPLMGTTSRTGALKLVSLLDACILHSVAAIVSRHSRSKVVSQRGTTSLCSSSLESGLVLKKLVWSRDRLLI